jgi:hypothetical protein
MHPPYWISWMPQRQHPPHPQNQRHLSGHEHGQDILYDLQQQQKSSQDTTAISFRVRNPFSTSVNVYVEV